MRKIFLPILLLLLAASPAVAEDCSHFISVSRDNNGTGIDTGTVSVYDAGTTNLVSIYSEDTCTSAKSNPFSTTANGNYDFWIVPGNYKIVVVKGGVGTFTADNVAIGTQLHADTHGPGGTDPISAIGDHGGLTGLTDDDHSQYARLAGRATGQDLYGDATAGSDGGLLLGAGTGNTNNLISMTDASTVLEVGTGDTWNFLGNDTDVIRFSAAGAGHFATSVGVGSYLAASATCISATTDRLFADMDCDNTKDAGEYFLDGDVIAAGVSGGQTINGGTGASDGLDLVSSSSGLNGTELILGSDLGSLNAYQGTGDTFQVRWLPTGEGTVSVTSSFDEAGVVGVRTRLRMGHATADASASCASISTDRWYGDLDCDNVKDGGEEFFDSTGTGYATIKEEGTSLTQRGTVNFIGTMMTCADDAINTRTNCTMSTDHGALTGRSDDDHTQYALLAGRAGGQQLYGDPVAGSLILQSYPGSTSSSVSLEANRITFDLDVGGSSTFNSADFNASGLDFYIESDSALTVNETSGSTEKARVDFAGVIGTDSRLRVGQSDSDANSTCLSRTSDALFHDTDCDGTSDVGEDNLSTDDDVPEAGDFTALPDVSGLFLGATELVDVAGTSTPGNTGTLTHWLSLPDAATTEIGGTLPVPPHLRGLTLDLHAIYTDSTVGSACNFRVTGEAKAVAAGSTITAGGTTTTWNIARPSTSTTNTVGTSVIVNDFTTTSSTLFVSVSIARIGGDVNDTCSSIDLRVIGLALEVAN